VGFKLKNGEKLHLPVAFKKEFTRYNFEPPSIQRSVETILKSISSARAVFEQHGVRIRNGSSMDQLLTQAERTLTAPTQTLRQSMDLEYVIALASLLVGLADEVGIKVLLERIAGSEMDTASRKPAQGKDAIWELSCFSTFKIGGMEARLAEPDVVTNFGHGDYGVACKKVYSENSVEKCIAKGVRQITDSGMKGLVALNIDELLIPPKKLMYASDQDFLRAMLQGYAGDFIERHRPTLNKYARDGACDGYIVSASRVALLLSTGKFSYTTVSIHVPIDAPGTASSARIGALAQKASSADGLEDWIAKVGGVAKGL
jgi:hypothetical protein